MNDGIAAHSLSADIRPGKFTWSLTDDGWDTLDSTTSAVAGEWTHLVLQWDGVNASLYVNGAIENTASSGYPQSKSYVARFGMGVLGGVNGYLDGNLLDLQVYSRALSASEILAGFETPFTTSSGLLAHYLDGTSSATDHSGNGRDATLVGPSWELDCP